MIDEVWNAGQPFAALTLDDFRNLRAALATAKFDNLSVPAAAVLVALLHKLDNFVEGMQRNAAESARPNQQSVNQSPATPDNGESADNGPLSDSDAGAVQRDKAARRRRH